MRDATAKARPWKPGEPVRIAGLGVILRSMSPADIDEAFIAQLRDPAISAHLAIGRNPNAITRANLQKLLATFNNRRKFFLGIYPAGGLERAGFYLAQVDAAGVALLTIAVTSRDQWRRGLSTAASYMLRAFLFDTVGVHKLAGRVYEDNASMLRLIEKRGWVREGMLREAEPDGKGGRRGIVLWGLLRGEHEAGPVPPAYAPPAG